MAHRPRRAGSVFREDISPAHRIFAVVGLAAFAVLFVWLATTLQLRISEFNGHTVISLTQDMADGTQDRLFTLVL
jgi:hypothetical protein